MTLRQIAELAGTTKSTVSRVLTHHPRISQKTRDRVMAVMKKHGYRPNVFARALAGGKTDHIGVLTSNISSGFFAEVIRGIDIAAGRNQGHLVVSIAHGIDDYYRLFDELRTRGQVDGMVLIDPPLDLFKRTLPADHLPLVLCASRAPARAKSWRNVDSVTVDNAKTMAGIVGHLAAQGLARLVHLAGPPLNFDAQQRRAAFEAAVRRQKLPRGRVLDGHLIREDGCHAVKKHFPDPRTWPDAFVAFNDSVALGVLSVVRASGGRVAVTGWDNSPAAEVLELTSAEMPLTRLGEMSARLLLDRIASPALAKEQGRQLVLDNELRIRASSHVLRAAETTGSR
jgi:LacI family transcriptional regulator